MQFSKNLSRALSLFKKESVSVFGGPATFCRGGRSVSGVGLDKVKLGVWSSTQEKEDQPGGGCQVREKFDKFQTEIFKQFYAQVDRRNESELKFAAGAQVVEWT